MKHTKLVRALVLFLLVAIPLTAWALVGPKNVEGQLRVVSYEIPTVIIPTSGTSTDTGGVILAHTIYTSLGAGGVDPAETFSSPEIGTLPYPAKLRVDLVDGGAASGALTCTSLLIVGKNQFGETVRETITSLTETEQMTQRVYESVDQMTTAGCAIASGGDFSDLLQVTITSVVGIPRKLRSAADIISMCFSDTSDSAAIKCYRGSGTVPGSRESLNEAGAVDVGDSAVDVADATLDNPLVNGDLRLVFRVRPLDPLE